MLDKEILGLLSVALSLCGTGVYWLSLWRGTARPHMFTWLVWGLITLIAFAAQWTEGAGPGSWVMALTVLSCFSIVIIAFWRGEKNITHSDWISFLCALAALPLWYATQNPLSAVILVTIIDLLGFYPTIRKSWMKPWDESAASYALHTIKFIPSLFALEIFNWTTALYPASLVLLNGGFVVMLLWRRSRL